MKFVPFAEAKKAARESVIAVDCFLPGALNLSHWRGAAPPSHADTSAAIVLTTLRNGSIPSEARLVTNNHFDIDGFIGVWALLNPEQSIDLEPLLTAMARLGDFRELPEDAELAEKALRLVAWINTVEKTRFYAPFGKKQDEDKACVDKFHYFLKVFESVLRSPDMFQHEWEQESELVSNHLLKLQREGNAVFVKDIRLLRIAAPEPLHYYALFGQSSMADMVLSMYPGNRYELEYKYTTWVDAFGRRCFPRISFDPLAQLLNEMEHSQFTWSGSEVTDTGPILRLGPPIADKEIRFDHPFNRPFYASTISPAQLEKTVVNFYREAFEGVGPKEVWTWEEIRRFNERFS